MQPRIPHTTATLCMPGYPPRHVCRAQAFFSFFILNRITYCSTYCNHQPYVGWNVQRAGCGPVRRLRPSLLCALLSLCPLVRAAADAAAAALTPTAPGGAADYAAEGPFQHRLSKAARGRYVACSTKCTTPPELRESIPKRRTAHIKIFYLKLLSKSLTSFT